MDDIGRRVAEAARRCVGVRFRPQGRDPALGLDCIGLAAHAVAAVRSLGNIPRDYPLRGGSAAPIIGWMESAGFAPADPARLAEGDILLFAAGPAQHHLAIAGVNAVIHADAGLGRVVERPGIPAWPLIAAWRLRKEV